MTGPGDFVRVVNQGADDLRLQWDSRHFTVPAGGESFVPFELAAKDFGDPRSSANIAALRDENGAVSFVADRATEVRRLRVLYDNGFGDETRIKNHPTVEVYDLEGNRIYTVLDDPDGERVTPAVQSSFDQADLMATVQRQQRLLDQLMKQAGMTTDANLAHTVVAPDTATTELTGVPDPFYVDPADPDAPAVAEPEDGDVPPEDTAG